MKTPKVSFRIEKSTDRWDNDEVVCTVDGKKIPIGEISTPSDNGMGCCGLCEIENLSTTFDQNMVKCYKYKELSALGLNALQVLFLTIKYGLMIDKCDEQEVAFKIITMPTKGNYAKLAKLLDDLKLTTSKPKVNPNTDSLLKVYILDVASFLKKPFPKSV